METRRLVDAMATYVQGFSFVQENGGRFEVQQASVSGVSSLTLTTPERLDSKIREGKTVEIPLWEEVAGGRSQVYVVRTWINNPIAWTPAKRLVASLEILHATGENTQLVIQLPENRDRGRYPRERTAFVTSNGIPYAELKSVLPENPRSTCFGGRLEGAGTLLLRDHTEWQSDYDTVYVPQNYSVELRAATTTFELGLGGGGLGQFRLRGRKEYKTYYECFVEATGEVLAIYLHRRRQHFGVVRFIGPGNHPELRDLIMGAMVAMGLDSQLQLVSQLGSLNLGGVQARKWAPCN